MGPSQLIGHICRAIGFQPAMERRARYDHGQARHNTALKDADAKGIWGIWHFMISEVSDFCDIIFDRGMPACQRRN